MAFALKVGDDPAGLDEAGGGRAKGSLYRTCRSMMEALIRLRPDFNRDLDQVLVYLIFLLDLMGGSQHGLNALSVAEITGIPRESVRRKLRGLVEAGFIRRERDGLWYVNDLSDAQDARSLQRALERIKINLRTLNEGASKE